MARAVLAILVVAAALPAAADDDPFRRSFDAVPAKPALGLGSLLTLEGAELLPPRSMRAAMVLDYIRGPLGMRIGDERTALLIPDRLDGHVIAAYGLHERIDAGLALPLTVYQSDGFARMAELGLPQPGVCASALSDIRLLVRGLALPPSRFPLGLAVILEVRLPTGDGTSFTGDAGMLWAPRLAVERRLGPWRAVANVGWRLRDHGQYLNLYVGSEFAWGVGAQLALGDRGPFKDLVAMAEVTGSTPTAAPFTFAQADVFRSPMEGFVGARARLTKRWGVELVLGGGLNPPFAGGYGREVFRVMLGLRYDVVHNDRDGDGVPDDVDRCPDEPGLAEHDGCPDRDGDDVPDIVDKCPNEPGPPELEGCPSYTPPLVVVERTRLRLKANIQFESGSSTLVRSSHLVLDEVAKVLGEYPQIEVLRIEGHTDNRGSHPFNLDLSARRAAAVKEYLVGKAVASTRMVTEGYAYDRPVATNATPLGRARNRRVDFRLLRVGGTDIVEDKPGVERQDDKARPVEPKSPADKPATQEAPFVPAPR